MEYGQWQIRVNQRANRERTITFVSVGKDGYKHRSVAPIKDHKHAGQVVEQMAKDHETFHKARREAQASGKA
jgi:hypothetical protein